VAAASKQPIAAASFPQITHNFSLTGCRLFSTNLYGFLKTPISAFLPNSILNRYVKGYKKRFVILKLFKLFQINLNNSSGSCENESYH